MSLQGLVHCVVSVWKIGSQYADQASSLLVVVQHIHVMEVLVPTLTRLEARLLHQVGDTSGHVLQCDNGPASSLNTFIIAIIMLA